MKPTQLGPYRIVRSIGQGGMGAVYAAEHVDSGVQVAIKVLAPSLVDEAHFRERFRAEIQSLRILQHPGIVQLYGFGEEEGSLYYAMELVEGTSLQQELSAGRRFAWRETATLAIEICRALRHAHDHGVIHRDLKPANLLLDPSDHLKLTDFGIARLFGSSGLTVDGGVLGTADYMSPEQAKGRAVTHRCDLYSLGSVMYAMLIGHPPFVAETMAEVLHQLRFSEPAPIGRLAAEVPEEMQQLVMQLLRKDPDQRIGTAQAIRLRLEAILEEMSLPSNEESAIAPDEEAASDDDFILSERVTADAPAQTSQEITREFHAAVPSGSSDDTSTSSPSGGAEATSDQQPSPLSQDEEPPTPTNQFVAVESTEPEPRVFERVESSRWPFWRQLAMLIIAVSIVGGLAWMITRPPSANSLYAEISSAAKSGDIDELKRVESQITSFLAYYAEDSRYSEIQRLQHQLHDRPQHQPADQAATPEDSTHPENLSEPSPRLPVERAFRQIQPLAVTDPEQAILRLKSLIALYGDDPQAEPATAETITLAEQMLEQLQSDWAIEVAATRAEIERHLQRASDQESDDPATSAQIRQGILVLYGEHDWAADLVDQARQALDRSQPDE